MWARLGPRHKSLNRATAPSTVKYEVRLVIGGASPVKVSSDTIFLHGQMRLPRLRPHPSGERNDVEQVSLVDGSEAAKAVQSFFIERVPQPLGTATMKAWQ